ncbi:hypothetical protein ROHU_015947 [Labeo rohita]|uniref:Uncharacterized protein n=1 Tax=Labeo rohita TaxID=84645 RepID=A0A498NMF0_LABRO|nr:hypothetical protein ROHU_015947 [Labeo rohita]
MKHLSKKNGALFGAEGAGPGRVPCGPAADPWRGSGGTVGLKSLYPAAGEKAPAWGFGRGVRGEPPAGSGARRRVFSDPPSFRSVWAFTSNQKSTTLSGGSLGSCVDEERSQLRELM